MDLAFQALAFVLVFVVTALAGMLAVRWWVPAATRRDHHEVTAVFFGIVGTIYSVLLAFSVFVVWTQFGNAQVDVAREATELSTLVELSGSATGNLRAELKADVRGYCQAAIDHEWPDMQSGKSSPELDRAVDVLWSDVMAFQPRDADGHLVKEQLIEQMRALAESRGQRLFHIHDELPGMVWVVIWAGAILTLLFSYLFDVKSLGLQVLMTAGLAAAISLMIFSIWAINQPFAGSLVVTPAPLKFLLVKFLS